MNSLVRITGRLQLFTAGVKEQFKNNFCSLICFFLCRHGGPASLDCGTHKSFHLTIRMQQIVSLFSIPRYRCIFGMQREDYIVDNTIQRIIQ